MITWFLAGITACLFTGLSYILIFVLLQELIMFSKRLQAYCTSMRCVYDDRGGSRPKLKGGQLGEGAPKTQ